MKTNISIALPESKLDVLGKVLVESMLSNGKRNLTVFLNGNLGMGKTSLTKAIIKAYGFDGRVKSPTYTLVEPYEFDKETFFHFDLYRLADPEELEFMGGRDYFDAPTVDGKKHICIVEWPEKGQGFLPQPNMIVSIELQNGQRVYHIDGDETLLDGIHNGLSSAGLAGAQ